MQKKVQIFMGGFFVSAVLIIGTLGFVMVDYSTGKYGGDLMPPMIEFAETEETVGIYFLGRGIALKTSVVNNAVGFIQQNHTVFIPAPIRLVLQGKYGIALLSQRLKEISLELQWRKNMGLPLFDDIPTLFKNQSLSLKALY